MKIRPMRLVSRRSRDGRRGITLIQMTLVMSAGAALLAIASSWLIETQAFSARVIQSRNQQRVLDRLAIEFRDDVHRSDRFEMGDRVVKLYFGGELWAEYRLKENLVERWAKTSGAEASNGDSDPEGASGKRESFPLATQRVARLEESDPSGWVSLIVARQDDSLAKYRPDTEWNWPVELHVRTSPRRNSNLTGDKTQ